MKKLFFPAVMLIVLVSCHKTEPVTPQPQPQPHMNYRNLNDAVVKAGQGKLIDLDGDGTTDFSFGTLLLGDPILQRDRLQFYAYSGIGKNLLNNETDESPVLNKNEKIQLNHPGYTWYEISAIVLTEKITPMVGNIFWQGRWTDVSHKYLPVQIEKGGGKYQGWIELSFDKLQDRLILHQAAICKEAGQEILAGL
jgi:hypothetical protein